MDVISESCARVDELLQIALLKPFTAAIFNCVRDTRTQRKNSLGITFLGTRLKSATKPPDGLDGLRSDPLTVRRVKAGVQGKEFF